MNTFYDLLQEAEDAFERVWFVQAVQDIERTDLTLSLRLYIRADVFVHVFYGQISDSLYFSLIEHGRRIFGIDRESGEWHLHPYDAPEKHLPFSEGLGQRPLLSFLAFVENLLLQHELL